MNNKPNLNPKNTIDIDSLEAVYKAATPGPLKYDDYGGYFWGPNMEMVADVYDGLVRPRGVGAELPIEQNCAYIVAAYNAVPKLIKIIRELQSTQPVAQKAPVFQDVDHTWDRPYDNEPMGDIVEAAAILKLLADGEDVSDQRDDARRLAKTLTKNWKLIQDALEKSNDNIEQ